MASVEEDGSIDKILIKRELFFFFFATPSSSGLPYKVYPKFKLSTEKKMTDSKVNESDDNSIGFFFLSNRDLDYSKKKCVCVLKERLILKKQLDTQLVNFCIIPKMDKCKTSLKR